MIVFLARRFCICNLVHSLFCRGATFLVLHSCFWSKLNQIFLWSHIIICSVSPLPSAVSFSVLWGFAIAVGSDCNYDRLSYHYISPCGYLSTVRRLFPGHYLSQNQPLTPKCACIPAWFRICLSKANWRAVVSVTNTEEHCSSCDGSFCFCLSCTASPGYVPFSSPCSHPPCSLS